MASDRITLTVPARAEYAKTVRMTASALVGRTGLTYDEVDDVRIAAEEAFVYACDHSDKTATVEMVFDLGDGEFAIRVSLGEHSRTADEEAERRAAYATFILQSVCDRFEMASDESGAHLTVIKTLPDPTEVPEPDDADE